MISVTARCSEMRALSIASAARSAASCSSVTSSSSKWRWTSVPMCITPITRPSTWTGTPSIERMPLCRRIGFTTSAWSRSSMMMGRASAATRPAKPRASGTWTP